ncbi:MAG TPA: EutN/CcmL family microcompartment protein [Terriglobales bacterium]|nr:EutN/CcmL family microcompartment protein [Terriglobales bacterium]
MFLARVLGNVVATVKDPGLAGQKLLLIQPVDGAGRPVRTPLVALDAVGVGPGEMVYYCRGREASFPWLPATVPADLSIVGVVDPAANPNLQARP